MRVYILIFAVILNLTCWWDRDIYAWFISFYLIVVVRPLETGIILEKRVWMFTLQSYVQFFFSMLFGVCHFFSHDMAPKTTNNSKFTKYQEIFANWAKDGSHIFKKVKTDELDINVPFWWTRRTQNINKNQNLYNRQSQITLFTLPWDTLYCSVRTKKLHKMKRNIIFFF